MNIAALQGFLRDSFQCDPDPSHVDPDILNDSIIPDNGSLGNAVFFLYFEEWLAQQSPFYPENHLDVRRILPLTITERGRTVLAALVAGQGRPPTKENVPLWKFCQDVLTVWDTLQTGHANFYDGEYDMAPTDYEKASDLAVEAIKKKACSRLEQ